MGFCAMFLLCLIGTYTDGVHDGSAFHGNSKKSAMKEEKRTTFKNKKEINQDTAVTFHSPPSNCYDNEQREVCRVEQPPERDIIDAAREWVSTRSRRISVVDRVSHWTARSHSPYFLFFLTLKPLRNFFLPLRTAQPSSEDCRFHVLPLRTAQPSSENCSSPSMLKLL
nr:hypothetical protein Iba_scaffold24013CG0080 [Ipomoea batatas]